MSAHLSPQEQVYLISRKLALGNAPRPLAQLFAHLAECAACQEAVTKLHNQALSLPGTNELNTNAPDTHEWQPAHLDYERLAGYVANNLESVEREIADNHLAVCEFCAQEMQELTALQHALANELPASRPARPVAWWKHFRMLWPKLVFERLGAPAFAFGMLLLLGGLGGWWWQRRLTETDMARQSNSTPAEINPTATAVAEAKPTSNPQPPAP
ncbi:MAG: hypothetical protein HY011_22975, partial [Acidobacteria bacterium]|nr:hypothetical protein [Acidobacteriota bacterium]